MRTFAVGRVVINHALPWEWMKWFESLPVMFFVSGTLVGRSLRSRDWKTVFIGRFKRLALPTAVYLAFAATMSVTNALPGTTVHLWYVWTFLLLTALSGVFRRLIAWSEWGSVAIVSAVVVGLSLVDQNRPALSFAYTVSWLLGMIWAERDCRVPSRRLLVGTALVAFPVSVVAVWALLGLGASLSPSKVGIAMLGLGMGWVAIGMLLRGQLEALMGLRFIGPAIRWLNKRLLTVYLWHLPATLLARDWSESLELGNGWISVVFVLAVTVVLTGLATFALGGLEDRASASSKRVKLAAESSTDPAGAGLRPRR